MNIMSMIMLVTYHKWAGQKPFTGRLTVRAIYPRFGNGQVCCSCKIQLRPSSIPIELLGGADGTEAEGVEHALRNLNLHAVEAGGVGR